MKRLASFAGGGTRGREYSPLLRQLAMRSRRRVQDLFDHVSGVSTGGITALLLARGYSPEETERFYYLDAPRIFRKRLAAGFIGSKYRSEWLEAELRKYLDAPLASAQVPVCVIAFDKNSSEPLFISSQDPYWADLPMYQAATATAAAPFFFNHYEFSHNGITNLCVDAGGGVNNPAREAIDEAGKYWPGEAVYLVNFDCSMQRFVNWPNGGILSWAPSVFNYAQMISLRVAAYACRRRLGPDYALLAPDLRRSVPMDSADKEDLDFIGAETSRFILQNEPLLDSIAARLAV